MVIEYAGTVIRSVLTDKREKFYDGKVSPSPAPSGRRGGSVFTPLPACVGGATIKVLRRPGLISAKALVIPPPSPVHDIIQRLYRYGELHRRCRSGT